MLHEQSGKERIMGGVGEHAMVGRAVTAGPLGYVQFSLLVLLLGTTLGAAVGWFNTLSTDRLTLIWGSIWIVAISAATAWKRFSVLHRPDLGGLFLLVFAAYNGLEPLQAAFRIGDTTKVGARGYPIAFEPETYVLAVLAGSVAAATLCIILWPREADRRAASNSKMPGMVYHRNALYVGAAVGGAGLLLMGLNYTLVGGVLNVLSSGRGARLDQFNYGEAQAIPYEPVFLSGLCIVALYYFVTHERRGLVLLSTSLVVWTGYQTALGSRSSILMALMVVSASYVFSGEDQKRRLKIIGVVVVVLYVAFASFGHFRSLLPDVMGGRMGVADVGAHVENEWRASWLLPSGTELSYSYFSLLHTIRYQPEKLQLGRTYIAGVTAVIPEALWPNKPESLARQFAIKVQDIYGDPGGRPTGRGFNLLAESIVNFGLFGPVVAAAFFGYVILKLSRVLYRGAVTTVFGIVVTTQAVQWNRTSFTILFATLLMGASFAAVIAVRETVGNNAGEAKRERRFQRGRSLVGLN